MAFENKNMSVIAYANGFTMWHYKTNRDTIQSITDDTKYFGSIYTLINCGDIIIVNAKDTTAQLVVEKMGTKIVETRRL